MATTSITGLPQTLTIDAATVVPADYNAGTYKVTMTTLGAFVNTNAATISASGNVTGGNLIASGVLISTSTVSATGNIIANNHISTGVLISTNTVSAAGNVTGGNLTAGTGNINANNVIATTIVNGASHTGTLVSVSGNITGGNVLATTISNAASFTGGLVSVTGSITSNTATVTNSITVNSNDGVTAIVNGGSNGTGNIGSTSKYFNQVFAQATTALYADLAEVYEADADYVPGTVVSFGGDKEVTISTRYADPAVAGVISANPSYLMNNGLTADHRAVVALTGRVPTSVTGTVYKGSMMISAGNGRACACATPAMGTVIGKALENFDGENGIIEIVVGRT
jgi:hypothetical protein